MGVLSRLRTLVLLVPALAASAGRDPAFDLDDECVAGGNPERCAVNALQVRGSRLSDGSAQEVADDDDEVDDTVRRRRRRRRRRTPHDAPTTPAPKQWHDRPGHQDKLQTQPEIPEMPQDKTANPIVVKGNFLYDSVSGKRFFAKGVAYNPRNIKFDRTLMKHGNCTPGKPEMKKLSYAGDPTADELEPIWSEALNAMAAMGVNTVRLYNIDPEISHKKFMTMAASLGIYVIVPLTRHDWGFLPAGSPSPACYEENLEGYGNVGTNVLISAKLIVKQFSQYDNVLMFTVANEMTVEWKMGYAAMPCVKALTRDIHRYQAECGASMRRIPLIYADMDMGPPYREMIGRYLTCALESEDDAVDAYGINVYSWCDTKFFNREGEEDFEFSPYGYIRKEFSKFSKPLLFTEFGCNIGEFETYCPYKGGRTWPDVKTFFNEFQEVMSGSVAFEFSMEDNQYGLVLTPGFTSDKHNKKNFYYLDNYFALKEQYTLHNVSSKWDGAEIESCDWRPSDAHKMKHGHEDSQCPSEKEVKKLFKDKHLDVSPNWDSLPNKPNGTEEGVLATCAEYEVAPHVYQEGCCHMACEA